MRWLLLTLLLFGCKTQRLIPIAECVPSDETCNGKDDNCNGLVDEQTTEACETDCGKGFRVCTKGALTACSAKMPAAEICDGKDNDCDGIVDNYEQMAVEFCYTGSPADLTHFNSPCSPGILRCDLGRKACKGQVLPVGEVCNGKDDNCDGTIDDEVTTKHLDIVMVIDTSGSMGSVISKVQSVVTTFQQKYANRSDLRWALVAAPDKDWTKGRKPTLQVDFTDPSKFSVTVNQQSPTGSGEEATVDAIDMLISSSNPLNLTWEAGSKKIIVLFADEEPQSYDTTETYQTIGPKIINAPLEPLADVRVFTDASVALAYAMWLQVVGTGKVFNINESADDMSSNLEKIILQNSCVP